MPFGKPSAERCTESGDRSSVFVAFAVYPLDRITTGVAAGVVAHRRICRRGIYMGHLLPEIPRRPVHRVCHLVVLNHMAPTAAAALRAEQLLQPFVAQHQHRIGTEDQLRFFGIDAPLLQLLRLQQMQVVLLAAALDQLIWMGRAEQFPFPGAAVATCWLRCSHPEADPISPYGRGVFGRPHASALVSVDWLRWVGTAAFGRDLGLILLDAQASAGPFERLQQWPQAELPLSCDLLVLNAEEEIVAIRRLLPAPQSRVLLVTSAFHMRRTQRFFKRQAIKIVVSGGLHSRGLRAGFF